MMTSAVHMAATLNCKYQSKALQAYPEGSRLAGKDVMFLSLHAANVLYDITNMSTNSKAHQQAYLPYIPNF